MRLPMKRPANIILAGLIVSYALSALGCDTVAVISFQSREFSRIESPGFTARAGSCDAISDGEATFRFVLLDDSGMAIRPGDTIGRTLVNLTADDVSFSGNGAIFETPDVQCGDTDAF